MTDMIYTASLTATISSVVNHRSIGAAYTPSDHRALPRAGVRRGFFWSGVTGARVVGGLWRRQRGTSSLGHALHRTDSL